MTDNRATPATRRDEATDRLAEIEARIAATVPPPAVEVDGEMVTPLSHAHAVAIGSWPWRSDIVWLVAQLRRTKPTLRAPEVTDEDADFAAAMRVVQLIVTMPEGIEHTTVPCNDLRAIARYVMGQQERIVGLESDLSHATQFESPRRGIRTTPKSTPTGRADGSA